MHSLSTPSPLLLQLDAILMQLEERHQTLTKALVDLDDDPPAGTMQQGETPEAFMTVDKSDTHPRV